MTSRNIPQVMIAAPTSGAGKTTLAIGLMALLSRKGFKVQPFKCGPDYIDTKFHKAVCNRPSVNLDLFMASNCHVREIYKRYSADADVCVVEGMMGLYDGYKLSKGSPADIAQTLDVPVVMVVDGSHAGFSIAPMLYGFKSFSDRIRIVGVIYNKVASERHATMLREAAKEVGLECLGCLPRQKDVANGERYLGLDFSHKIDAERVADMVEKNVDWQRLLEITKPNGCKTMSAGITGNVDSSPAIPIVSEQTLEQGWQKKIMIARNSESFSFLYQEHIDILKSQGEVEFFDPEEDVRLPEDTTMLYLPGGYPEKHLSALEKAERCRKSIKEYAEHGGRIIAECGGMMYLCRSIIGDEGETEMCGVLPYSITARKSDRKLSLGYRQVVINGKEYRGHEFHYTQFLPPLPPSAAAVYDARGNEVVSPVIRQGNVIASYTHLYWG
ncbi:MAG: cobyrinate a,c-diamide synthase [Prevotellaceae bacterium]|nr:cobyrinate a,c-diamide synthase [Prevotellaceae bacterium]